jgi:hypothetical protein
MTWYVANLIGENIVAEPMPVESRPNPLAFGDSGEFVYVLYGDRETGVTVCLDAADEQEAARLIRRAFDSDPYIDDLQESAAQEPPKNLSFVVSTCHDGTDWCVRAATQREINDPDEETLPYDEAVALAGEHGRFFDFSTDFNRCDDEQNDEDATPPDKRTILVHLNVEAPASDQRSADEIADALLAALEVGSDDDRVRDLKVVCPMAEAI